MAPALYRGAHPSLEQPPQTAEEGLDPNLVFSLPFTALFPVIRAVAACSCLHHAGCFVDELLPEWETEYTDNGQTIYKKENFDPQPAATYQETNPLIYNKESRKPNLPEAILQCLVTIQEAKQ